MTNCKEKLIIFRLKINYMGFLGFEVFTQRLKFFRIPFVVVNKAINNL